MAELGALFSLMPDQNPGLALGLLLLVCAVTAFISAVTGGAGGILMFAALNIVIPLRALVPIHGAVQLMNNLARVIYVRGHIRWEQCIPFFIGCTFGSAAMTLGLAKLDWQQLPLVLLAGLIFYTVFKPNKLPEIRLKPRNFFWVGIATGTLGIVAGAVDPLLGAFFVRKDMTPREIVASKSVMQAWCHALKIPAFIYLGFAFSEHLGLILLFTVAAVIGTRIGIALLSRINSELFFNLMRVTLLVAGARIVYQLFAQ